MKPSEMSEATIAISKALATLVGEEIHDAALSIWVECDYKKWSTTQMAHMVRARFPGMRLGGQSLKALLDLWFEANTLEDEWAKEIAKDSPNLSPLDERLHNAIWDLIFAIKIVRKAYTEVL